MVGFPPPTDGTRPPSHEKTVSRQVHRRGIQNYSRGGHHDPNLSVPKTAFELIWWRRSASDSSGGLGSARTYLVRAFDDTKKQPSNISRREYAKSGVCSGGKTFVTMMQSANLRNLHDPTHGWRLNRPTDWCVLAQRQMRPGLSIFAEQSFPAQGADDIEKWKCTVIAVLKGRSGGVSNCGCDFACHSPLATAFKTSG